MTNSFDDELRMLTDEELLAELTETDLRIDRLEQEIRRRMGQRAADELRQEQHAEIIRLMRHLDEVKVDWQEVREFFRDSILEAQHPRDPNAR